MHPTAQIETVGVSRPLVSRLPATARLVLVSANPRAGFRWRQRRVRDIVSALGSAGYEVRLTYDLTELGEIAAREQPSGRLRAVVSVGGDGTASVVRNHVPLEIPMVVVPMGTENLLGRYVEQETDPAAVCRTVDEGVSIGLDLGRAGGKYFLLMISVGFDAEVVRVLHEARRGNISRGAYVLPLLRAMRGYTYPRMRVYCDDAVGCGQVAHCRWLFGFNLPLYALGLSIAPQAVGTDGQLDLCVFERGGIWSVARYLWHVKRGRHTRLPDTTTCRCSRFRVETDEQSPVVFQMDGDVGGVLPVDVEVVPGALRLLVSANTARTLGFALPQAC